MNISILQFAFNLAEEIYQRAERGEIRDLDVMAEAVLNDCKATAVQMIQEIIHHMNEKIRQDKQTQKEMGLVIKEKDRTRKLLTALGQVEYARDYFYDKEKAGYVSLLDQMLGVEKYERVGAAVGTALVSEAAKVSYARSADIVTGGAVSPRRTRNYNP